jgi:hypothetical protein
METGFPNMDIGGPEPGSQDPELFQLKAKAGDEDRSLELAGSDLLLGC